MGLIKYCFNWKKYPANVLFMAIPLFLIGIGFAVTLAVLHILQSNDWNYLYIMLGISTLGSIPIIQLIKML